MPDRDGNGRKGLDKIRRFIRAKVSIDQVITNALARSSSRKRRVQWSREGRGILPCRASLRKDAPVGLSHVDTAFATTSNELPKQSLTFLQGFRFPFNVWRYTERSDSVVRRQGDTTIIRNRPKPKVFVSCQSCYPQADPDRHSRTAGRLTNSTGQSSGMAFGRSQRSAQHQNQ